MKASLTEDDCIFQVDFTGSYRNDLQKSTQSAYFRDQSFSNFISCRYPKPVDSGELQNNSAVVVTESSDHNSLVSMTCLKTVLDKTEKYEMAYNIFLEWWYGSANWFSFCL